MQTPDQAMTKYYAGARKQALKRLYGLTVEQYDTLLAQQGDACAICKIESWTQRARLHVDHCHDTGVVRGLLCRQCNSFLISLERRQPLLRPALEYLEKATCPSAASYTPGTVGNTG